MCKVNLLVTAVFVIGLIAGCGSSGVPSDPVSDYREFVNREITQWEEGNHRAKFKRDYKIDVVKTESLVSPFIGTCKIESEWIIESSDGTKIPILWTLEIEMTHQFQEKKWIRTSGKYKVRHGELIKRKEDVEKGEVEDEAVYRTVIINLIGRSRNRDFKKLDDINRDFYFGFNPNDEFKPAKPKQRLF